MFQMSASSIVSGCCGVAGGSLTGRLQPVSGSGGPNGYCRPQGDIRSRCVNFHAAVTQRYGLCSSRSMPVQPIQLQVHFPAARLVV